MAVILHQLQRLRTLITKSLLVCFLVHLHYQAISARTVELKQIKHAEKDFKLKKKLLFMHVFRVTFRYIIIYSILVYEEPIYRHCEGFEMLLNFVDKMTYRF